MPPFLSHLILVFQWAAKHWWAWVWSNIVLAAVITAGTALVGIYLVPRLVDRLPFLRRFAGDDTMDNVVQGLILAGVAALVMFVVFLAMAPSQIYDRDQKAIAEIRKELAAKNETQAHLIGEVRSVFRGFYHDDSPVAQGQPGMVVVLDIVLRNTGEPSIAEKWHVTTKRANGEELAGKIMMPSIDFSYSGASLDGTANISRTIAPGESMIRQTANPIAKGAAVYGNLIITFPGITNASLLLLSADGDSEFAVECIDIYGARCICKNGAKGNPPPNFLLQGQQSNTIIEPIK